MKRILGAGLLAGIAIFIWGGISWVVLPWHNLTLSALPEEDAVVTLLKENRMTTGTYYFPAMPHPDVSESAAAEWTRKHRAGPLGVLFYHAAGENPMGISTIINGFIISVIAALLAASLLSMVVNQLQSFRKRVYFISLIGLFAAIVSHVTMWNWFYLPADYTLVNTIDLVIAWTLGGLVLAWRIKPVPAAV